MKGIGISPSPNWYLPQISSLNSDKLFAFGARNTVVLLDCSTDPPQYKDAYCLSEDKVICVSFCRETGSTNKLLVVTEDKSLRIVCVDTGEVVNETKVLRNVASADWIANFSNGVVLVDDKGSLLKWTVHKDAISIIPTFSIHPVNIISSCPFDPSLVAIGYKNGLIVVQEIRKERPSVYKLKGHDETIVSLSWHPQKEKFLLTSTSLDKSLRIWDVPNERTTFVCKVPVSNPGVMKRLDKFNKARYWTTAVWIPDSSSKLLCSSVIGDVAVLDTSVSNPKERYNFLDTKDVPAHDRSIFNLSVTSGKNSIACSVSLDRNIVLWDLVNLKATYCLPTLGGFVYHLSFSPLTLDQLAVASGDGAIRVWNTASPLNPYSCLTLWQGVRGKVMTLAWHPSKENLLAFGTDEGKVGIMDIVGRTSHISSSYHKHATYVVCWAEINFSNDANPSFSLLSCGDGVIKVHNPKNVKEEAQNLNKFLPKDAIASKRNQRSGVAYNSKFKCLTIGNSDGSVEIYNMVTSSKLALLQGNTKPIENMQWHPLYTATSSSESVYKYWLACTSLEHIIHIYDLTAVMNSDKKETVVMMESTRQLLGHHGKISAVAWSVFQEGFLVSASYDQTVQVWNAVEGEPVANYRGHNVKLYSCQWSPCDPDIVYSGGEDLSVHRWNVSQQEHKVPKTRSERGERKKTKLDEVVKKETNDSVESSGNKVENGFHAEKSGSEGISGHKLFEERRTGQKSYFPVTSSKDYSAKHKICFDEYKQLTDFISSDAENSSLEGEEQAQVGFFTNSQAALALMDLEIAQHKKNRNFDHAFHMELWKGNSAVALKEALKRQKIEPWMVAIAPTVSRSLWLELCDQYAQQLSNSGDHHMSAIYFLACNKVYDAINVLLKRNSYREAILIAKTRLPATDPKFQEIYSKWANQANTSGYLELASKCYLAQNDPQSALNILAQRRDPHCLRTALYIAKKFNLVAEADELSRSCFRICLLKNNWDVADLLIKEQDKIKSYRYVLIFHKTLTEEIKNVQCENFPILEETDDRKTFVLWRGHLIENRSFAEHVLKLWADNNFPTEVPQEELTVLEDLLKYGQIPTDRAQVWYLIAINLTLALLSKFSDEETANSYLVKSLNICYSFKESSVLHVLCLLLFPSKVSFDTLEDDNSFYSFHDKYWHCETNCPSSGETTETELSDRLKGLLKTFEGLDLNSQRHPFCLSVYSYFWSNLMSNLNSNLILEVTANNEDLAKSDSLFQRLFFEVLFQITLKHVLDARVASLQCLCKFLNLVDQKILSALCLKLKDPVKEEVVEDEKNINQQINESDSNNGPSDNLESSDSPSLEPKTSSEDVKENGKAEEEFDSVVKNELKDSDMKLQEEVDSLEKIKLTVSSDIRTLNIMLSNFTFPSLENYLKKLMGLYSSLQEENRKYLEDRLVPLENILRALRAENIL